MTENQDKIPFVSLAWVDIARGVLEDLVTRYGEAGKSCSICESFAEAPREFADADGFASWYFYIDGKSVCVGSGRVTDTDVQIQVTWELALPGARLVYTPEILAEEMKKERPPDPNLKVEGNMTDQPSYLEEFHNRMAVVTA